MPPTPPVTAGPATQPPTGPDQMLTSTPAPGGDWQSALPPVGRSSEDELAFVAAPVQPVNVAASRRRGLRWLVAAAVVVLVAASASAVFFVVAGAASPSTVSRWAPAESIFYMEARFDLPGDQRAKAGEFLSAFPGFADPSTLDTKLSEVYDKAIRSASGGKSDYSTDIKPWFGGQVAISLAALPGTGSLASSPATHARGAFLLSVTDATKAGAWLTKVVGGAGSSASYGGVALTAFGTGDSAAAVGVDGTVLIGGDVATVHAIIDGKGADGLAGTADFKLAVAAAPKDRVGFVFMEGLKFMQAEMALMPSSSAAVPKELLDRFPAWLAMSTLFESDSLIIDAVEPNSTLVPVPPNHVSTLAAHLPATTIAELEAHDVGSSIKQAVTLYQSIPAYKDGVGQVLDTLDKIGGLDSFTSWFGDTAVAVTLDGTTVGGGVVVALPDKAASTAASAKFASLKNIVSLSGLPGVKVTTAAHGDATITTIDFGSLNDLQSLAPGLGSGLGGGSLPAQVSDARIALSYTVTDSLVVVGIGGDGFVKAVLDAKAGASLADQPRYKTALERAGASNLNQGYVDLQAISKAAEAALPPDALAAYQRDVKPYLTPFSALVFTSQGGDLAHGRFVVTVAK
ncbi:MAG TPA: DUF3352 domain-containing protein [Candidatus Limnocylindrales bacterium]